MCVNIFDIKAEYFLYIKRKTSEQILNLKS